LGPELGQCCGGAVTLLFEPFAPADLAGLERLAAAAAGPRPVVRSLACGRDGGFGRDWRVADEVPAEETLIRHASGSFVIGEWVNPPGEALFLFGAGHVGRAVVPALLPLGFAITWIDGRAGAFPPGVPAGVRAVSLAVPE